MAELLEQRENWGSRGGFILAAIGSAVGLGNLWGFPYKIYSYGGGAFLIPYIIALFVVGLPILILEFSMGHFTQRAAPNAFRRCGKPFETLGWLGVGMCWIIITFYPVILAYCFTYFWYSIVGIFNGGELPWAAQGLEGVKVAREFFFDDYLHYKEGFSLGSIQWQIAIPLVITWILMHLAIFKGVNLVGKIVWFTVPIPWLLLLVLTVRGLTLEGSVSGLAYYLTPTWSELAKPITWRFAFGQVFFSMSLAYGTMITYSSFLHKKSDLNNNALIISLSDFATSFIAGVAIFATLGGMAFVTAQAGNPIPVDKIADKGVSLAFIAFPYALAQLPYSAWFSFFFFLALITLGIDSAFSITETALAGIVDKTGLKRSVVLPIITVVGLLSSMVYITSGGLNWVGVFDGIVNGTWGISFLGLLECLVLGWYYRLDILRNHSNARSDWRIGFWWDIAVRFVLPTLLGMLFFWNLYDDINRSGGLFKAEGGGFAIDRFVSMLVTVIVFVASVVITFVKSNDMDHGLGAKYSRSLKYDKNMPIRYPVSFIVFIAGLWFLFSNSHTPFAVTLFIVIIAIGLILSLVSNKYIVAHYNTNKLPNITYGHCGVLCLLGMGAALTGLLVRASDMILSDKEKAPVSETLSGVSYIILTVVAIIIVVGLGWSFSKVITASDSTGDEEQVSESI
ncbi:MAG: sodium-dependent transporter [Sedimentisphaeraceae bacterium JB056]